MLTPAGGKLPRQGAIKEALGAPWSRIQIRGLLLFCPASFSARVVLRQCHIACSFKRRASI